MFTLLTLYAAVCSRMSLHTFMHLAGGFSQSAVYVTNGGECNVRILAQGLLLVQCLLLSQAGIKP